MEIILISLSYDYANLLN